MVPEGDTTTAVLLENKEEIMEGYGKLLFAEEPDSKERRARLKMMINAYDMGAPDDVWVRKY